MIDCQLEGFSTLRVRPRSEFVSFLDYGHETIRARRLSDNTYACIHCVGYRQPLPEDDLSLLNDYPAVDTLEKLAADRVLTELLLGDQPCETAT